MMNGWPTKKLGEVSNYFNDGNWIESKDQSDLGIRLIQTGNVGLGNFINKESKERYISELTFNKLKCNEIFPGDVLISRLPDPVGRACILPKLDGRSITAVDCTIARFSDQLLTKYFLYYSQSSDYFREIEKYLTGSSRVRISKANLKKVLIKIPPANTQKNIVERLDTIRKVQELCDTQISKTEELFESVLIKQFDQNKNWKVKKLPEVAAIQRGKFSPRPRNDPKYFGGDTPWIQTGEIVNSNGEIDKYTQTLNKEGLKVSRIFPKGTIVITIAANIGDLAMLNIDAAFPDSIVGMTVDETLINNKFLYYEMLLKKEYLNNQSTQAAQKNINIKILSDLDIFVPELNTQKKIVEKLDSIQEYIKLLLKQKTLFKELFDSVLYKSMKGDMDS